MEAVLGQPDVNSESLVAMNLLSITKHLVEEFTLETVAAFCYLSLQLEGRCAADQVKDARVLG